MNVLTSPVSVRREDCFIIVAKQPFAKNIELCASDKGLFSIRVIYDSVLLYQQFKMTYCNNCRQEGAGGGCNAMFKTWSEAMREGSLLHDNLN